MQSLTEFEGKKLLSAAQGDLDLPESDDEKKAREARAGEFAPLVERLTKGLGDAVKEVRLTNRLTDSPACLVADEHDMSANLARMLKAAGQQAPATKPILEINPKHPVVERLKAEERHFDDWANVLFDQAVLAEGGQLDDPAGFVRRVNELMLTMTAAAKTQ